MKKVLFALLMFAATATVFTGCKKDDDKGNKNANSLIVGKWKGVSVVWVDIYDGETDSGTEDLSDASVEFASNGTFKSYDEGELEDEGTYKVSSDGKKLTMDFGDDDIYEYEIKKITSSECVLYEEDIDGNNKYTSTITFKKI